MKRHLAIAVSIVLGITTMGCANSNFPKQAAGAVIGGIGGGLAGSRIGGGRGKMIAIVAGTVMGALAGAEIGRQLDERDKLLMARARQDALENRPSGVAREWRNPDTGSHGRIVPKRAYRKPNGQYCREYRQTIIIAGKLKTAYGTACRQADGSWRILS